MNVSATHFTHTPTLHRVFGRVVSIEPKQLFDTVKEQEPTELQPTRITQAVDYLHAHHLDPADPILELHSSFYDVRMIMRAALDTTDPPLDLREAVGVARHRETSKFLARVALYPSVYYTERILEDPSIVRVESRQYLDMVPGILPDHRIGKGCPFAGDNPERKLYPIFLKYASWAAEFCVYDYYEEASAGFIIR